ncbi:MAG: PRC-barrel domain-containing protein [Actinophytocola sp.]|uniref:PRC-barrel domain-containing protein n=1 Tax=Actinophytocola sp. TaxID=1872138 RepID=UPI003C75DC87
MIGQDMVNRLYDCQVVDPRGEKIGSVKRVWLDGQTGDPLWASVHTGLFGLKESFVPLQRAELRDDHLRVPVEKEQVKGSPRIEATHDHMTDDEQAALYRHYGFGPQGGPRDRHPIRRPGMSQQPGEYPGRGRGPTSHPRPPGGGTTTQPKAGTGQVETGRVRLVKHVVTEQQRPVTREKRTDLGDGPKKGR